MSTDVDLRELAIDRSGTGQRRVQGRRHVLTRYVLPLVLCLGFTSLVAWASRDLIFPPRDVTVVPVASTTVASQQEGTPLFNAAGWIEPRPTQVRVAALAPGVVEKLLVVEDQLVQLGDPIAELVTDDAELIHQRVLAELELRVAELDEVKAAFAAAETRFNQPVHLEAALAEADALLAKIQTQLKNLPFELRRAQADHSAMQKSYDAKVAAKGAVAGIEIEIAKSLADSAKSLVEELTARSESLLNEQTALARRRDAVKKQLELRADETQAKDEATAKVNAAAARVSQVRVAVAEAKLRLDRMTIVSPIDGRIFRLVAQPGARLSAEGGNAGQHDDSTVVTMYRPDRLQVRVDVRFEDIPRIRPGQLVDISNAAFSSSLSGSVLSMSSEADIQKNTLQVKVEIFDPPSVFKPEMLVDVTFLAPKQTGPASLPTQKVAHYMPQTLVHTDQSGSFVWLADQSDGIARKTTIQTGAVGSNGLIEIISGLNSSSRIITGSSDSLHDGDRIRVTREEPNIGTEAGRTAKGS